MRKLICQPKGKNMVEGVGLWPFRHAVGCVRRFGARRVQYFQPEDVDCKMRLKFGPALKFEAVEFRKPNCSIEEMGCSRTGL
jgi:hypothetical protein